MDTEMDLVARSRTNENQAPNDSTTIQIPAELFKSLVSSVERFNLVQTTVEHLQQAVSRLEDENTSLKGELQVVHDGKGPRFPQFSKFPIEIRKMIVSVRFSFCPPFLVCDSDKYMLFPCGKEGCTFHKLSRNT
jgi:hypothetical protein